MNFTDILPHNIQNLLEYFSKNTCRAKEHDSSTFEAMQKCISLMELDYKYLVIPNNNGELSANYPSQLIIPEYELEHRIQNAQLQTATNCTIPTLQRTTDTIYESIYDSNKLRDLIAKARFARCRARFPLPVILYKGKHICRSATLSGGPEIYGRSGLDYLFFGIDSQGGLGSNDVYDTEEGAVPSGSPPTQSDWQLFDRVRSQDIKLLKTLNVGTIVDFMVEKKKVKFGMNVTSSEKVDKENRYSDFTIISLPYPGCEFFKDFRDNDYIAEGLVFDWSQAHVDANIGVPDDSIISQLQIDWNKYKMWDLVKITQNYMKLLLRYLQENGSGLLIHCISGWDRTPLFVSLLRMSLWADGTIHQSLNASQILYFTIAYDWMLFGHNLADRLNKGEEIFFFCFYFLKHLIEEEYSVLGQRYKSKHSSGSSSIGVLRNDSDCLLDGVLFDGESRGSSVSLNSSCSCISNKSQDIPPLCFHVLSEENTNNGNLWLSGAPEVSCSSLSDNSLSQPLLQPTTTSTQQATSNTMTPPAAWSPQARRTSPVAVPVPGTNRFRQRTESTTSSNHSGQSLCGLSVGSWQLISGTGSLRDVTSIVECSLNNGPNANGPRCDAGQVSQDSSCTMVEDDCFTNSASMDYLAIRRERLQAVRALFYNCYCSTIGFKFKNGPDSSLGSLLGNFAEKVGLAQSRTTV